MPVMDGIELLRAVRRDYPMIHTIMITGYVTMENVLACMRHGADTLVFKPLEDLALLDQAIVHAVESIKHWTELMKELHGMKLSLNEVTS
jgi:CheY-like chemotaxis protein